MYWEVKNNLLQKFQDWQKVQNNYKSFFLSTTVKNILFLFFNFIINQKLPSRLYEDRVLLLFWRNFLNSNNGLKHITFKSQNSNQYFRSVLYLFSLSQFGILLSETVIRNHLLIYILAFRITIHSPIILFRLFCGTLIQELRNETISIDSIEQTYLYFDQV